MKLGQYNTLFMVNQKTNTSFNYLTEHNQQENNKEWHMSIVLSAGQIYYIHFYFPLLGQICKFQYRLYITYIECADS